MNIFELNLFPCFFNIEVKSVLFGGMRITGDNRLRCSDFIMNSETFSVIVDASIIPLPQGFDELLDPEDEISPHFGMIPKIRCRLSEETFVEGAYFSERFGDGDLSLFGEKTIFGKASLSLNFEDSKGIFEFSLSSIESDARLTARLVENSLFEILLSGFS